MNAWADNPQAPEIDALIKRAGQLTPVERDRLVADRDAARDAARVEVRVEAWSEARVAARVAARDAARDAARLAARLAARVAARVASRDADWFAAWVADRVAEALAVRDLIDEATPWNREAYDLLTGPWRRAIGPVHPDDEVLR